MNTQETTVLNTGCGSLEFRNSLAGYIEKLAGLEDQRGDSSLHSRNRSTGLRELSLHIRRTDPFDQALAAVWRLAGLTTYEPGQMQDRLLQSLGRNQPSPPTAPQVLAELAHAAAHDVDQRHRTALDAANRKLEEKEAELTKLRPLSAKVAELEAALEVSRAESADFRQKNESLTFLNQHVERALGGEQSAEIAQGLSVKRRVSVRGQTGIYTVPGRDGIHEIDWTDEDGNQRRRRVKGDLKKAVELRAEMVDLAKAAA